MPRLIAGRLAQMAATLLVVSALVWLVMGLMPGDPADLAMMADPALTPADIKRLRAAHGLDLRAPLQPGPGSAAALGAVRARIDGPGADRRLAPDLAAAEELVAAGTVQDAVEAAVGAMA